MSITYTYEIVSVDAAARCMEIVYSAEGHQTMRICTRLPFAGEDVEVVVAQYAPVRYWEEAKAEVAVPAVGLSGTLTPVVEIAPVAELPTTLAAIVTEMV